ncbi:methyl-accepting chemotaxis protein [Desulfosporosinus sp. HMP52]|uniref:methyl-accepting chemotaxis protein n=1 Tax=Desulfosporosinus sp. HMP52 TaxID=1487923 RepID=UPI00068B54AC|nr:methyl-accepting chemotaxis protein [Desulfosporosinus sp. HMP52]
MNLKIRTKLLSGFLLLLILIGLVGYLGLSGMNRTVSNYNVVVHTNMPVAAYVWELRSLQLEQTAIVRGYFIYQDEKYPQQFADSNKQIADTYDAIQPLLTTEKSKAFLAEFKTNHDKYRNNCETILALIKQGKTQDALNIAEESRQYVDNNKAITLEWTQWVDQVNTEKVDIVKNEVARKQSESYIVMLLAIIVGLGTGIILARSISRPVVALAKMSEFVAKGDLTQPMPIIKSGDEIETLAKAYGTMLEHLRSLIQEIGHTSQQLASTSEEMSASAQETNASAEQVASTVNQLALGASQQATDAEKSSSIVTQMVAEIQQVETNVQIVAITGEKVAQTAQQGSLEAENVIAKMDKISTVTTQTGEAIKTLGLQSEKVGQIINVIKDIADQTNLLALNAAIEAARAGDHGRGFAVVADEVRKLAEKSSISTQQIAELINNIQKDTIHAVKLMDLGSQDVIEGVEAVTKASGSFKLIAADVEEVVNQIQQVQSISKQMSNRSREVAQSIDSIAAISQQTAAFTEEVNATGEEQIAAVAEVSRAALELTTLAEELNNMVLRFKY